MVPETYDRWPGEPGAAPGAYDRSRERWEPWWPEGPEEPGWGAACGSRGHGWRLRGLTWGRGGLRATIDRGDARVTVTFDDVNSVVSARWSGAGDRDGSLGYKGRSLGALEGAGRPTWGLLYELRDSEFQDWAAREGAAHGRGARHLCLVCDDDYVDVLFLEEPGVEVSAIPPSEADGW